MYFKILILNVNQIENKATAGPTQKLGHFEGFKLYFEGLHTLNFLLDQLKTLV